MNLKPTFFSFILFYFLHELCIFKGGKIGLVIKFIISIEFVQFWNNFSFSFSFYVCFVLILHLSPFFFLFGEGDCTFNKTSKPITRHYHEWYLQYNQKFLLAIWSHLTRIVHVLQEAYEFHNSQLCLCDQRISLLTDLLGVLYTLWHDQWIGYSIMCCLLILMNKKCLKTIKFPFKNCILRMIYLFKSSFALGLYSSRPY